ncbi:MAG: Hsp20/alpha crystallin family protein [Bacteriovorax sp.]|nr:Hsp20/alpha crystallin family protein [Bacteriovorax sp.]
MNLAPWKSTSAVPVSRTRIGNDLASFQREMNSLMNNFFTRGEVLPSTLLDYSFYPTIDLKEKNDKYLLDADLPGMNESDIDIDFHDNILTIKGEKKSEKETRDLDYVCVERSSGSFRRDIYLDEEIDQSNIKADLKDGVLHMELTKKEPGKSTHKKIPIKH